MNSLTLNELSTHRSGYGEVWHVTNCDLYLYLYLGYSFVADFHYRLIHGSLIFARFPAAGMGVGLRTGRFTCEYTRYLVMNKTINSCGDSKHGCFQQTETVTTDKHIQTDVDFAEFTTCRCVVMTNDIPAQWSFRKLTTMRTPKLSAEGAKFEAPRIERQRRKNRSAKGAERGGV